MLVKRRRATARSQAAAARGGGGLPGGAAVRVGAEVPLDTGEIGFAAESQIVVGREDLQAETTKSRIKPGPGLPGISPPELFAPLVFDQETLGLVVMRKPRKTRAR